MKNFTKISILVVYLSIFFFFSDPVLAADPKDCECYSDLDAIGAAQLYKNQTKILKAVCVTAPKNTCFVADQAKVIGKKENKLSPVCFHILDKDGKTGEQRCNEFLLEWGIAYDAKLAEGKKVSNSSAKETSAGNSALSILINKCGQKVMDPACFDVTVFVELMLQIINYLFGIIGALALGAFVYGGFVLILSQGSQEKVSQGTGAMINAVIGIVIAFSGYVLITYFGEVLHLKEAFKLLQ